MSEFAVITPSYVKLNITNSVSAITTEKSFPKNITVGSLKNKLEMITGCQAATSFIEVFARGSDKLLCKVESDEVVLGSLPVEDGVRVHVTDTATQAGIYDPGADGADPPALEMSMEEYDKRDDTLRAYLRRNKMGAFRERDPEEERREAERAEAERSREAALAADIHVGDRCELIDNPPPPSANATTASAPPTGDGAVSAPVAGTMARRRGVVRFVGATAFRPGPVWVGVALDEPLGKNDGAVAGERYFECPPRYGVFVRVDGLRVGDYPELGIDELDEI